MIFSPEPNNSTGNFCNLDFWEKCERFYIEYYQSDTVNPDIDPIHIYPKEKDKNTFPVQVCF